ncbi:radical SAM protein [Thermodesulfobacteriota bacterium]
MLGEILRWRRQRKADRLPLYLIVFVTYRCNARCRTCFYHEQVDSPPSQDLPLEFYEKVAPSLDPLGWLHLSGGEPFLRADLPELVGTFYRHTGVRKLGIPTNGLLPERVDEMVRRILRTCPDLQMNVVLSLDGLEETHDRLRGVPGNWGRTLETLNVVKRIRETHAGLSLNVCTVLNNGNVEEIPELLRTVKNMGVDFHDVGLMRGDFRDKTLELPDPEIVERILALVDTYARDYYQAAKAYPGLQAGRATRTHRLLNRGFVKQLKSGKAFQPCFVGDGFAVIEPNGDVRLCELTPVVGNLKAFDGDFRAFWTSEAVRRARREGRCPEGGCTHSNFQTRNFILNPYQWWKVLP